MPPPEENPPAPDLARLFDPRAQLADPAAGTVTDPTGTRLVYASHEFVRAIHHVLAKEKSGAWRDLFSRLGRSWGREIAAIRRRGKRRSRINGHRNRLPANGGFGGFGTRLPARHEKAAAEDVAGQITLLIEFNLRHGHIAHPLLLIG